jgi:hypothetical protein
VQLFGYVCSKITMLGFKFKPTVSCFAFTTRPYIQAL